MQSRHLRVLMVCFLILFASVGVAEPDKPAHPHHGQRALSKVNFELTAEAWVKTKTAKVIANCSATVKQSELANINQRMLGILNELAENADWHITTFNRNQDRTGLEQINVVAEARLPENRLADLNVRAKKLTHEGQFVSIADIQFTPTLAEMEEVRATLRASIYKQVKAEIASMNQVYSDHHYQVKSINFGPMMQPQAQPRMYKAMQATAEMASAPSFEVSDKITMAASVVIADKLMPK